MKIRITPHISILIAFIMNMTLLTSCTIDQAKKDSRATEVTIKNENGKFKLYKDGQAFYIKGAGLGIGIEKMESIQKHGGNSIRTWSVNNSRYSGKEILDEAQKLGLMVCMGIDMGRERHGFDYNDEQAVQKQFDRIKAEVTELKDHPALLMWGIGNELNLSYKNDQVWIAVNEISKMIHQEDGNHPTTTMLAGAETEMLTKVMELAPDLDLISFQFYGALYKLPGLIEKANYTGPYIVSEWGTTGHWEVEKTSWNRPIEESSSQKVLAFQDRYHNIIQKDQNHCLGSYVFLWGHKQERTPTWYGLLLESGEETEMIDMMHFLWNDKWPENRAPQLVDFLLENQRSIASVTLRENQVFSSNVIAKDPENDSLTYKWEILNEVPVEKQSEGGDFEPASDIIVQFDYGQKGDVLTFKAPVKGEYRIFIYVKDQNGKVATANIPFLVTK